jgi:hypothetical protein
MKQLFEYNSVAACYEDAKKDGLRFPLELCGGVSQTMQREQLSFAHAFAKLLAEGKIIVAGRSYVMRLAQLTSKRCWR